MQTIAQDHSIWDKYLLKPTEKVLDYNVRPAIQPANNFRLPDTLNAGTCFALLLKVDLLSRTMVGLCNNAELD